MVDNTIKNTQGKIDITGGMDVRFVTVVSSATSLIVSGMGQGKR